MGPTPVYGDRAEEPLQNADFAVKQTNICRLSGDINEESDDIMTIPPAGSKHYFGIVFPASLVR